MAAIKGKYHPPMELPGANGRGQMEGGDRMKDSYNITDAEREVMEVLWEAGESVRTGVLLDQMKLRGRSWKRQTLNTLLARLDEKGIVIRKRAFVEAAFTEKELFTKQTQGLVNHFYGGKLENFCAAFIGKELQPSEVEKLNALVDEIQKRK